MGPGGLGISLHTADRLCRGLVSANLGGSRGPFQLRVREYREYMIGMTIIGGGGSVSICVDLNASGGLESCFPMRL